MFNPSKCRIIAIGKVRKAWIQTGLRVYKKRLPDLSITEIRDSNIQKETNTIKSSIKTGEVLIALCEKGESLTSMSFYHRLQKIESERLVFIIGGPNGLSSEIKNIARFRLSLSPLTFPHELARLLLLEQLYRATTIAKGSPYHRR